MGKIINWIKSVIAVNHIYANMAGVNIKKSSEQLFEAGSKQENAKSPQIGRKNR